MLILTDSVYKLDKSYYPQALSEECKYVVKDKGIKGLIIEGLHFSKDESGNESESGNEADINDDKSYF